MFFALKLASSSLLRLGSENEKEAVKNRESVYILLDLVSSLQCVYVCARADHIMAHITIFSSIFQKKRNSLFLSLEVHIKCTCRHLVKSYNGASLSIMVHVH